MPDSELHAELLHNSGDAYILKLWPGHFVNGKLDNPDSSLSSKSSRTEANHALTQNSALCLNLHLIRQARRSLSLRFTDPHSLRLSIPLRLPEREWRSFLSSKMLWIARRAVRLAQAEPAFTEHEIRILKLQCRRRCEAYLATYPGRKPFSLCIRHQKTRWGSCSSNGTISINVNAALLSDELFEYLMVHELCHLYEMNHGPEFWRRVEQQIPDWRIRRKALREINLR